ncbi:MAG: 50S ribosomal protein L37ae [Nanoarchaeota archaeon]|nr:50S ribosomal protein L37ae [Nanoarchaeota archaeon]
MGRTKKIGTAGRFGARYGKKTKDKLIKIEKKQRMKHECPSCQKKTLKREASGIWLCTKCDYKMAGKAYTPK